MERYFSISQKGPDQSAQQNNTVFRLKKAAASWWNWAR